MGKPGGRAGKKKNAGVGVDFKRAKRRVGKKLPRAQNQTDTSFKSRTISLAEQSLAADKAGQAVTTRNLTLKELLGQSAHYSERVRRDALQGLSELLAAHPAELRRHATLVVEATAARLADGDAGVRSAARELLAGALLPGLGGAALAPHVPLLMAHVCAALTHLSQPIRADALAALQLLTGARADLVARGWLAPVLLHFGDLLSRRSRGRSIAAGSLASLAGVAAALEQFLSAALAALAAERGGGDGGGGGGGDAEAAGVLAWRRCAWPPAAPAAEGDAAEAGPDSAAAAAAGLLAHLVECWAEAGAAQLAEAPDLAAAACLTSLLSCCNLLLGHWGAGLAGAPGDRDSAAAGLLRQVAPHFPARRPAVAVPPAVTEQLVLLNVAAAQLLARFLPAAGGALGGAAEAAAGGEQPWVARLLDWFGGVMAEGAALPDDGGGGAFAEAAARGAAAGAAVGGGGKRGGGGSGGAREAGLPGAVYQSALDGTLRVLPLLPPPRRAALLAAAAALWARSPPRGGARPRVLAFWAALLADPTAALCAPTPGGGALLAQADAAGWLAALPRWVFELGGGSPAASRAALELLLQVARAAPPGGPLAAALQPLQPQLAPLFAVLMPAAAAAQRQGGRQQQQQQQQQQLQEPRVHVGPLALLPRETQELAVDLLYHFPEASEQLLRTAAVVCLHGTLPAPLAGRLLGVLAAKAAAGAADPSAFCGLLLNVLSGSSAAGLRQRSWARHAALAPAACAAARRLGTAATAAAALLPPLLGAAEAQAAAGGGQWAAWGVLQLAASLAAAAADAAEELDLPAGVTETLPVLMLRLLAASQQRGGGEREGPDVEAAATACLRLLRLRPSLLPPLLSAVPASLAGRRGGEADGAALPAALELVSRLLRDQQLRQALLEQAAALQAALAACGAAADAAGDATVDSRACREQLPRLEALAGAVLGC